MGNLCASNSKLRAERVFFTRYGGANSREHEMLTDLRKRRREKSCREGSFAPGFCGRFREQGMEKARITQGNAPSCRLCREMGQAMPPSISRVAKAA